MKNFSVDVFCQFVVGHDDQVVWIADSWKTYLSIFSVVHEISRTFWFFWPPKIPTATPFGGGGGNFFSIQRHNIPSFCRLCISSLGNNMAPWTTWRDFSGTAHDATLLIQVLWYGWGVVYTRWLSPNMTAAVLRRRRSRRNKGKAETNTDLFTAANPNTITTYKGQAETFYSFIAALEWARETAANESRWRKQARWRKIATL